MSAFYRLPVESRTIIAQYVTGEKRWLKAGKALRLTHPHFANLDYLNVHLFHNITFHATPEGIDRLKAHPQALKSLVRNITFIPSDYGTDMTFFHFRRIVIKQCAFYCPADCRLSDHSTRRGVGSIAHLESAWAKDPLFSPEELLASYHEYHKQAQAARALLADGSLQVWTNAIKQLSNIKAFEHGKQKGYWPRCGALGALLSPSESDSDEDFRKRRSAHDLPTISQLYMRHPCLHTRREQVCGILPDHPHDEGDHGLYHDGTQPCHTSSLCQLNTIRLQAGLIEPISACIKNAGAHPEKLTLSSALTPYVPGCPLPPNLRSLDLSRLSSLSNGEHNSSKTELATELMHTS